MVDDIIDHTNESSRGTRLISVPLGVEAPRPGHADGKGSQARFATPLGIACDRQGNILVADAANHLVRSISPAGEVTTLAGVPESPGYQDGPAGTAKFNEPSDLVVDAQGRVIVVDSGNNLLRTISPEGQVTTLAGVPGASDHGSDGIIPNARFCNPSAITIDAAGNLFVVEQNGHVIRKITAQGLVTTLAGHLVPDSSDRTCQDGPARVARLGQVQDILATATGTLWVTDGVTIREVSANGSVNTISGSEGRQYHLDGPLAFARYEDLRGLCGDPQGNVYVADGNTIRKISRRGEVSTWAGTAGHQNSEDGPRQEATFLHPTHLAIDSRGRLFVTDRSHMIIRCVDLDETVRTWAGTPWDAETAWNEAIQRSKKPGNP